MNVLYIHTHDTGRYIGPYGHAIETPELNTLSRESVVLRSCFSTAPTCSPSRAGLLTGTSPHSCGMTGLAHRGFRLTDPKLHIVSLLKAHGFETVLSGIQHEAPRGQDLLYDKIISSEPIEMNHFQDLDGTSYDLANAENVSQYLRSTDTTFFLSFGMFNTHREFPLPADMARADSLSVPSCIADTPANRKDLLSYHRSAEVVDDCVGIVMKALKESGREKDTIVIFTTDHGIAFPRMKCTLLDTGIGVACMLKYPGNPLQGKASDAMISHLDILPTLFDLLGLPVPRHFQGVSLLPLLEGTVSEVRDELFAEVTYHAAYEPLRCVRTKRFKYIRRFDETFSYPVPANMDDCPAKTDLVENGYFSVRIPGEELFDLLFDPEERINLANDPSHMGIIEDLRTRLRGWMQRTDDPLLRGPVPLPKGALANKRTCVSPSIPDYDYGI